MFPAKISATKLVFQTVSKATALAPGLEVNIAQVNPALIAMGNMTISLSSGSTFKPFHRLSISTRMMQVAAAIVERLAVLL